MTSWEQQTISLPWRLHGPSFERAPELLPAPQVAEFEMLKCSAPRTENYRTSRATRMRVQYTVRPLVVELHAIKNSRVCKRQTHPNTHRKTRTAPRTIITVFVGVKLSLYANRTIRTEEARGSKFGCERVCYESQEHGTIMPCIHTRESGRKKKAKLSCVGILLLLAVAILLTTKLASFCTSQTSLESSSITSRRMPGLSHIVAICAGVPAAMLLKVQQASCSHRKY